MIAVDGRVVDAEETGKPIDPGGERSDSDWPVLTSDGCPRSVKQLWPSARDPTREKVRVVEEVLAPASCEQIPRKGQGSTPPEIVSN